MIPAAIVPPREPVRKTGVNSPAHAVDDRMVGPSQGDPFNTRNIVHEGDFFMVGKPFPHPGVHKNIYTNIPGIQSVANKFFGYVLAKVYYPRQVSMPRGVQQARRESVNIEIPTRGAYGDTLTFGYGDPIPGRDTY